MSCCIIVDTIALCRSLHPWSSVPWNSC